MRVKEYLSLEGRSAFAEWFTGLDAVTAAKVTVALARLAAGNFSNSKSVGTGVLEHRIDYGPGYRIYYARDGAELIVLLAGGTKRRQQRDIEDAIARWRDYKARRT